ncbi:MAG TPA: response regulator, partial [Candidatus Polarisedimenticolia bacterium]|nr:response regulator [Candidatus Polarisedimenticolia bacterium]
PKKLFGKNETVLLVEDEEKVRSMARQVLEFHGYSVLEAKDWNEAEQHSERHSAPIHLLLTDMVMPGVNGREVYERLAARRQDLKVVYMSGYTETAIVNRGILEPGTAFIQKPFELHVLLSKIREVLDATPDTSPLSRVP